MHIAAMCLRPAQRVEQPDDCRRSVRREEYTPISNVAIVEPRQMEAVVGGPHVPRECAGHQRANVPPRQFGDIVDVSNGRQSSGMTRVMVVRSGEASIGRRLAAGRHHAVTPRPYGNGKEAIVQGAVFLSGGNCMDVDVIGDRHLEHDGPTVSDRKRGERLVGRHG